MFVFSSNPRTRLPLVDKYLFLMWKLENLFNDLFRMSYYAVAKGRQVGLFKTWSECESQVKGFRGAVFKKFPTEKEAKDFISKKSGGSVNFEVKKDYVCKNSDFTVGTDELSDEALLCLDIPELKVTIFSVPCDQFLKT